MVYSAALLLLLLLLLARPGALYMYLFDQGSVAAAKVTVLVTFPFRFCHQVAPFDLLAGLDRLSPQQLQQRAAAVGIARGATAAAEDAGGAEAADGGDSGQPQSETAAQRILVATGLSQQPRGAVH